MVIHYFVTFSYRFPLEELLFTYIRCWRCNKNGQEWSATVTNNLCTEEWLYERPRSSVAVAPLLGEKGPRERRKNA